MNLARWPWFRKWFGNRSESAAVGFLKKLGYRILVRNHSTKVGELDAIARDRDTIVFVEVRSTGSDDPSRATESVNYAKQRQLTKLAQQFLAKHKLMDHSARFDVLIVHWPGDRKQPDITHYKNAFDAVEW